MKHIKHCHIKFARIGFSIFAVILMSLHQESPRIMAAPPAINDGFKQLKVTADYCGEIGVSGCLGGAAIAVAGKLECQTAELWWQNYGEPSLSVTPTSYIRLTAGCEAKFKVPSNGGYFVKLRARIKSSDQIVTAAGCVTPQDHKPLEFRNEANNNSSPNDCSSIFRPLYADVVVSGRIPESGIAPILCQNVPGVKVTASLLTSDGQTINGTIYRRRLASRNRCFVKFTDVPLSRSVTVNFGGTFAYASNPRKPLQIAGSRIFQFDLAGLDPHRFEENEVELKTDSGEIAAIPPTAVTEQQPQPSAPSPKNALLTFEKFGIWKRGNQSWGTFAQSNEQIRTGQFTGKFDYSFPTDAQESYVIFQQTALIPNQPTAFQLWVYGDGEGNYLNLWVTDKNNRKWQFSFGRVMHKNEWRQMTAYASLAPGWPNEMVDGQPPPVNGIAYPLKLNALVIDGVDADLPTSGVIYVDDLTATNLAMTVPSDPSPVPAPPSQNELAAPATVNDAAALEEQDRYYSIAPGQPSKITIRVKNTGTTTWLKDQYGYHSLGPWESNWGTGKLWRDVKPGEVIAFESEIVAPTQLGNYDYGFVLQRPDGSEFGPYFFVRIYVENKAGAPGSPPTINFTSDLTTLNAGDCATLSWDTSNVEGVYLDGKGVVGSSRQRVCPISTTTFRLQVKKRDGTTEERSITIEVKGQLPAAPPAPSIPSTSDYGQLPVQASDTRQPAAGNPDLNLSFLGYQPTNAPAQFADYGNPDDPLAPQLRGLFQDRRVPNFTAAYINNGWDWNSNSRVAPSAGKYPVTVIGVGTVPNETILAPSTARNIGNGFVAMVLYADEKQITLKFTPEDSIARGYTLFIEGIKTFPLLLEAYRSADAAGRKTLPAVRAGQMLGFAAGGDIRLAMRDSAEFMDIRSKQDWWRE